MGYHIAKHKTAMVVI